MQPLVSQLVGPDSSTLVLHMPTRVTDEYVGPIRDEVRARLPQMDGAALVLDFSATELINSIGITCMLSLEEECRGRGIPVLIAALPTSVERFFQQLKLIGRFQITATLDEALAIVHRGK